MAYGQNNPHPMSLIDLLVSRFAPLQRRLLQLNDITRRLDDLQMAVGRVEQRLTLPDMHPATAFHRFEFKVFSQWGEDGLIQYLLSKVPVTHPVFVEFGVHDYKESNTRYLLQHDNWTGLIMDGSQHYIDLIQRDAVYYRNNLTAACAFIDRENINTLLRKHGVTGDIGLLSIDIDGNDYWVWEAIDCISPRIVVCEYDSLLGPDRKVSTPYDPAFERLKAHWSFLYGGASLAALEDLARRKGYALVGSNSAGNNAFFVRKDLLGGLTVLTPQQAYVRAQFRHSHDQEGRFTFKRFDECLAVIADMPVVDIERNTTVPIRDLYPGVSVTPSVPSR
jgi:hypothetical protein